MGELDIYQAIPRFVSNESRFDTFVNGAEMESYTASDGSVVPSVRKFMKEFNDRLVAMEHISIASISVSPSTAEKWVATYATVAWELEGTAPIASIDVNGQSVSVDATSWTSTSAISVDTVFVLTITDTSGRVSSASVSFAFRPRVYWGSSASASLSASAILALSGSALSTSRARTATVNASGGAYAYYAYPSSFGTYSDYKLFGFSMDPVVSSVTVTTPAGFTGAYTVLRSPYIIDDTVSMEVS